MNEFDKSVEENEPLSRQFSNQIENFDDDEHVFDGEIVEEISQNYPSENDSESNLFSSFIESLPGDKPITIIISRLADRNYAGQFRIPCKTFGFKGTIYWEAPMTADEVCSEVQKKYGGGYYQFQVRQGRGFAKGKIWTQLILDGSEPSEAEETAKQILAKENEQPRKETSQPFGTDDDAVDRFFSQLEKWQKRIEKFQPKAEPPPVVQSGELSVEDRILLTAIERTTDASGLNEKIIEAAFGIIEEKREKKESWIDLAKYGIQHPEEVKGLLGVVVSTIAGLLPNPAKIPPVQSRIQNQIIPGQSQKFDLNQFAAPSEPKTTAEPPPSEPTKPAIEFEKLPVIDLD